MTSMSSFHTQLASIMEVLANAAVAEICELVDNGYAVLQLEISRSQKENKALKRKLHMMELRTARGSEDRTAHVSSLTTCPERVQLCDELRRTSRKDEYFPTSGRATRSLMAIGVWGNGEPTVIDGEDSTSASTTRDQSEENGKINAESLLIKKEKVEEDLENSDLHGGLNISEDKTADGGERSPIVDTQTVPATDSEELTKQQRTRPDVWDQSGLDTVLKAEPEIGTHNLQDTAGRLNRLVNDYVLYERPGQLDTFFTQRTIETDTEGPVCSYSTETNSESLSAHPEPQLAPITDKGVEGRLSALDSLDMKSEVVMMDMMDSVSNKMDGDLTSSWSKDTMSGTALKQHKYSKEDGKRGASQLEDVMNACTSHDHLSMRETTTTSEASNMIGYSPGEEGLPTSRTVAANHRTGTREKRFLCTYCWKSFTCPKNLETHLRVHTGEKPFGCTQCGKRFSQSAHLKKHYSVHTGEKPFRCTRCGKCFSDSSNLKRHQYVHTGERPFRCTQCGKRFSFLGNLKRHQSVHLGKKALGRTPWEDFALFKSPQ